MTVKNMKELRRYEGSRIRKIGDSYYFISDGECYKTNEIGALLINVIGKDISMADVSKKISCIYNNSNVDSIAVDIRDFLNFLMENGIISIHLCEEKSNVQN